VDIEAIDDVTKVRLIREVAQAAGTVRALIGGQVLDIQNEGRRVTADELDAIHTAKTGALIRCAVRIGAIIGGAGDGDLALLTEYGAKAGLAFQIADDLLDETATSEELGKTAGKDAASEKATYAAVHGFEAAKARAEQLCLEAIIAAEQTGRDVRWLTEIARFIIERRS
jgi:geranylgeranyl diphosphate synthase type II